MSIEQARKALRLFEEALALPAEQRSIWIDETCGEDHALAREVKSLLLAHGEATGFLDSGVKHLTPHVGLDHVADSESVSGRRLGDFIIERQIGAGGMGVVFRAHQVSLNRAVALKVLPPFLRYSKSARTRFSREIEAAARLQHRNIVAVYTTGEEAGTVYYSMELIEGFSMSELISTLRIDPLPEVSSFQLDKATRAKSDATTLPKMDAATPQSDNCPKLVDCSPLKSHEGYFRVIARLLADAAAGLDYAHGQHVIHRDVKPSNLLFSLDGEIHISDFGLAHIGEQPGITRTGEILGTPYYMAPEQIVPNLGEVDGRTDVYALGATLYELLTLRPPFLGDSRDQVISQIDVAQPASPRSVNREVPNDLDTICLKALEKQKSKRYQSAGAMAADLRSFADGRRIDTRPTSSLVRCLRWVRRYSSSAFLGVGILGLIAAVLFFAYRAHLSEARWNDAEFDRAYEAAQFSAMEGDLEHATAAIDEAEQLGASEAQLNLLRGQLALQSGLFQQACDLLKLATEQLPTSVSAHALLSKALDANEQHDETAEILSRLEKLEPVTLQDYLLLGQARLYNDYDMGIALLNEAVEQHKTNVVARLVRGSALIYRAKVSGEAAHAEAALNDLSTASQLLDGNAYLLGRTLEARLTAATTYHLSGDLSRYQHNLDQAAKVADALSEYSQNYRSHRWRAFYFDYIGDDDQALISWRAMKNTRIAYLVIALFRLGEFNEAIQLCDERIERFATARFTEFFRALILSAQVDNSGEILGAFKPLDKETLDPLNAHRFNYTILCLAGQLRDAQDYCRRLRESDHRFEAHDAWRVHLLNYTCGELDEKSLLELSADSRLALIEAHFYIGISQLAIGNRTTARQHFHASAKLKSLTMLEGPMSRAFIAQLDREPHWPPWID